MRVVSYLFFNGNCAEAFKFYESVLGGTIEAMLPSTGTPAESAVSPEWRDKIMHAAMKIGEGWLYASDTAAAQPMQGFHVSLQTDSVDEAERIFKALGEG